jgi:hypothetical protein
MLRDFGINIGQTTGIDCETVRDIGTCTSPCPSTNNTLLFLASTKPFPNLFFFETGKPKIGMEVP